MQTAKKQVSDSCYLITVELTADETDKAIEEGVPQFLDRVQSMQLEEGESLHDGMVRRFGAERADRALADAVINHVLPAALNEAGLEPACSPVPLEEPTPQQGQPYAFRANVYVLPPVELSDYDTPVQVTVKRSFTTEDEIDQQLLALAAHFSTIEQSTLTGNDVRNIPTIDDNWVKNVYPVPFINTLADLRAQLRNHLDAQKNEEFENQKVNAAVNELSKRLEGEPPEEIVDIIFKDMVANIEEDVLANEGKILNVVLKEQKIKREDFERGIRQRARESVLKGMTMDAVFRHEDMEIADDDLEAAIQKMTVGNGDEGQVLQAQTALREMGRTPELVEVARRLKAGQWIADHAQVTEEV